MSVYTWETLIWRSVPHIRGSSRILSASAPRTPSSQDGYHRARSPPGPPVWAQALLSRTPPSLSHEGGGFASGCPCSSSGGLLAATVDARRDSRSGSGGVGAPCGSGGPGAEAVQRARPVNPVARASPPLKLGLKLCMF